ncbi:hypothetical protein ACLOJK_034907 [Asimina triloba]
MAALNDGDNALIPIPLLQPISNPHDGTASCTAFPPTASPSSSTADLPTTATSPPPDAPVLQIRRRREQHPHLPSARSSSSVTNHEPASADPIAHEPPIARPC